MMYFVLMEVLLYLGNDLRPEDHEVRLTRLNRAEELARHIDDISTGSRFEAVCALQVSGTSDAIDQLKSLLGTEGIECGSNTDGPHPFRASLDAVVTVPSDTER
ncbi:hypothetical protein KKF55_02545 [Patescibacteria group bacterium]|nr:hypothetical protein [Patescibacteria group bacterium]